MINAWHHSVTHRFACYQLFAFDYLLFNKRQPKLTLSKLPTIVITMIELIKTDIFDGWLRELRDIRARAKIEARIRRLSLGNPGDVKPVGKGVSELRIPYGPGYRVYYITKGPVIVVLLCGGDKATQSHDIELAKAIAAQWKE
tara:strand:- start:500 stop:928 length:429 start_codon:yes stop_codon:yes gene_type:complete